jgi:hypothetical protein
MSNLVDDYAQKFALLTRRYAGATPDALIAVLCPLLIPIESLDKTITKLPKQNHYRASFSIKITEQNRTAIRVGRTGKFVPSDYGSGAPGWREIAKGRIISVDHVNSIAQGEVYTGGNKALLKVALNELQTHDFLEIDQYGAAAKVLSALAEYSLVDIATSQGYKVCRMPEDMAKHLGAYANYDFEFEKNGVVKKIEVKSLWGTNTSFARLIHSTTSRPSGDPSTWTKEQIANYYPTSSCKFSTQDIFAVSLFLRTGNIRDFAFARSVPKDEKPYGLPRATGYPNHVNQNPLCCIGDGVWFATIDEVWNLD